MAPVLLAVLALGDATPPLCHADPDRHYEGADLYKRGR
jgi:hypothetical protein